MLFSLDAMTTYGHDDLGLQPHWRLMGALEALTGLILFGPDDRLFLSGDPDQLALARARRASAARVGPGKLRP